MKTYIEDCSVFRGFVNYKENKNPFFYDCRTHILYIIPNSEEKWRENKQALWDEFARPFIKKNEWIPRHYIKGYSEYETSIVFETTGEEHNINGFIQYEVSTVFEYNYGQKKFEGVSGLIFESPELNDFYKASSVYKHKKEEGEKIIVESIAKENKKIALFDYDDIQIEVDIKIIRTIFYRVESPLKSKTQLIFKFSKKIMDLDKLLDIIMIQNKFMQFITYRKNVKFEKVRTIDINEDERKENKGIVLFNKLIDNEEENNKYKKQRIIKLEDIENHVSNIYTLISKGDIYFSHLCSNISAISSYNILRISRIFAEFERTYKQKYGDNVRSQLYYDTKNEMVIELRKLQEKYTGKKRECFKKIARGIEKSNVGLEEKIKYALQDCWDLIDIFLDYCYVKQEKIEDISSRLAELRNDMIHGEMTRELEPINLDDIKILEILIYVIILKYTNLSKDKIQNCIKDIFRII